MVTWRGSLEVSVGVIDNGVSPEVVPQRLSPQGDTEDVPQRGSPRWGSPSRGPLDGITRRLLLEGALKGVPWKGSRIAVPLERVHSGGPWRGHFHAVPWRRFPSRKFPEGGPLEMFP
jgi:hypothetical protein